LALPVALIIVGVAAYLRLWQLGAVPAFFHFDEGNNGADALRVLAGEHALYFGANRGREGLIIYGVAAFTALLGRSMLAARLTGALASTLAVLAVFWLGSVLFAPAPGNDTGERATPWRGYLIGAIGAGVMAASLGLAIIGRTGLRANLLPLLLPLAVGLLWTGVQRGSNWRLALAGAITGLLAYTYISARFFPFLLLLWGATFLLPGVEGSIAPRRRANVPEPGENVPGTASTPAHPLTRSPTHPLTPHLRGLAIYAASALLAALPMIAYFALHPADFSNRSAEVWLFNSQLYDGNPLTTLLRNVRLQLSVLGFAGDPSWRSNYGELPLLHPLEAFFFWLGVGALLFYWRRASSRLLLLWLLVFLTPAVFSYDLPRNTFRMLALAPAIYLTLGYGVWTAAVIGERVLGAQADRRRSASSSALATPVQTRTSALQKHLLVGLAAVAAVLIGARAVWSADLLFNRWAHEVEANVAAPNVEWIDMLNVASAAPAGTSFVIPTSEVGEYATSSFDYLYQGSAPVHMLDASRPDLAARLYELLAANAAAGGLHTVLAADWDREAVADAAQRIPFLLNKYGEWQEVEERTYYRLGRYTNVDVAAPWQLYDRLEPLEVSLDGGITLAGIAAGAHGGEQIATQAGEALPADDKPAWLALRWQAEQAPKANYRLSLRLFDAAGATIWQQDAPLVDDLNRPTSQWQPGQVVESYHTLALPPELPPGQYELRAIVYDETTLTPIVQVGVWTPEIVLAQVQR
jgi:4-amino-4-deoxy-L-arabinose transferase-like glycosyltransferase